MNNADLVRKLIETGNATGNGGSFSTSFTSDIPLQSSPYVVMAEIPINNTTLHRIATGTCLTATKKGEQFAIRFMLKDSFKAKFSNYVVNNFIMQIIAIGKDNAMTKEDITTKIKIQTVEKIIEKKPEVKIDFNIDSKKKELF